MLQEIKRRIPSLLEDIEVISLTKELIFIQMREPMYARFLMEELEKDYDVNWAHSRGSIVSVDNYPVRFNEVLSMSSRIYPPIKWIKILEVNFYYNLRNAVSW